MNAKYYTAKQAHELLTGTGYDLYNSIPELNRAGRAPEWAVYAVGPDGNRHGYIRERSAGQVYANGLTVQIFDRAKINRLAGRIKPEAPAPERKINFGRWVVGVASLFASGAALVAVII